MLQIIRPLQRPSRLVLGAALLGATATAQLREPVPMTLPEWQPLGELPGAGPEVHRRLMPNSLHPERVYAFSTAGILCSMDRGASWSVVGTLPEDVPVFSVADVSPVDPDRIALSSLRIAAPRMSWDGGATWWEPATPPDALSVFDVAFDPVDPDVVFFSTTNGVWRSTDGGVNFTQVLTTSTAALRILIDRNNRLRVYARVASAGLQVSLDGGDTWSPSPGPPSFHSWAIDPVDGRRLLVGGVDGAWLSEDEGATWSSVGLASEAVDVVAFDAVDRERFYAGLRYRGLAITDDRGVSWAVNLDPGLEHMGGDPQAVLSSSAWPGEVLVAGRGGFARSTDGGTTFQRSNAGLGAHAAVSSVATDPSDPTHLVAKTGGSAFVSLDGGATWTESTAGHAFIGYSVVADSVTPGRFWAGGLGSGDGNGAELWRSDDGGFTFHVVFQNDPTYFWHLEPHPTLANVLFGAGRGVLRSDDGGATFTNLGVPSNWVWDVAVSPADPDVIYASTTYDIYWSHDGGTTWSVSPAPTLGLVRDLEPHPANPLVCWAAAPIYNSSAEALYRTDDGGQTWTPMSSLFGAAEAVHRPASHPGLLVTSDFSLSTVFASRNSGASGFDLGRGIRSIVRSFHSTATELYAASAGQGVLVLR